MSRLLTPPGYKSFLLTVFMVYFTFLNFFSPSVLHTVLKPHTFPSFSPSFLPSLFHSPSCLWYWLLGAARFRGPHGVTWWSAGNKNPFLVLCEWVLTEMCTESRQTKSVTSQNILLLLYRFCPLGVTVCLCPSIQHLPVLVFLPASLIVWIRNFSEHSCSSVRTLNASDSPIQQHDCSEFRFWFHLNWLCELHLLSGRKQSKFQR